MSFILTLMGLGALGVLARYEVQVFFSQHWPNHLHVGTLLINVFGSCMMGAIYVLSLEKAQISDEMRVAILVGFLGGFTTFSAYALDSIRLLEAGNTIRTFLYVALSPSLSILFCFVGMMVARKFG